MARLIGLCLAIIVIGVSAVYADEQIFTGRLDSANPTFTLTIDLLAGQSVRITAEATSGNLDTALSLKNADGIVVAANDDRSLLLLDSALGYTAPVSGVYTVVLGRFEGRNNSGDFTLKILIGDSSVLYDLNTPMEQVILSGPTFTLETAHFRIHYTVEGVDAAEEDFVREVGKALETVWRIQVNEMGWPPPPTAGTSGGDARVDVYLMDLLHDSGYGILGLNRADAQYGDNPNTPGIEQYASASLIRLDNDFAELWDEDPSDMMRSTAAHEFFHTIQRGFDYDDPHLWYAEATAVWMETATFPDVHDAARFVWENFHSPDLCFGLETDPYGGILRYGEWMFIQSLVDVHGDELVFRLWDNIAQHDGFAALEATLAFYGDSVPNALARYRVQNLVRDYRLAPEFAGSTVLLSDTLTHTGRTTGYGVQELGANYLGLDLPVGSYRISLLDNETLELWAVGVRGTQADAFRLGQDGAIDTSGYDYVYLMVFNPVYDESINDCADADYEIEIAPSSSASSPVERVWNAKHFLPPYEW